MAEKEKQAPLLLILIIGREQSRISNRAGPLVDKNDQLSIGEEINQLIVESLVSKRVFSALDNRFLRISRLQVARRRFNWAAFNREMCNFEAVHLNFADYKQDKFGLAGGRATNQGVKTYARRSLFSFFYKCGQLYLKIKRTEKWCSLKWRVKSSTSL